MFHLLSFPATICISVSLQLHGMLLTQERCSRFTTSQGMSLMIFKVSCNILCFRKRWHTVRGAWPAAQCLAAHAAQADSAMPLLDSSYVLTPSLLPQLSLLLREKGKVGQKSSPNPSYMKRGFDPLHIRLQYVSRRGQRDSWGNGCWVEVEGVAVRSAGKSRSAAFKKRKEKKKNLRRLPNLGE